ncbi:MULTISPECIES: hypothetical protein [Bacillus cereus group]|uniref:hypothetical protein n=1 Tax=Bacillus cereus group TaxID=86661 RepID=UPI000BECDB0E|nr:MULTISPECIES: hypothetical protein [Bacillus cereus group]PEA94330.1 hypothetical protein CON66_19405 [Bacillus cereus]PED39252.1 hypothetical protein CON24_04945 [Bacillus cereus]PEF53287.1 hypothetical protein CON56_06680 [Bacillus thuringiensis]PEG04042.1 hypothetical protein CON54_15410 [Bacillus cereus]PEW53684.1 hypothetical protein CN438_27665 [Bacillus cereus]
MELSKKISRLVQLIQSGENLSISIDINSGLARICDMDFSMEEQNKIIHGDIDNTWLVQWFNYLQKTIKKELDQGENNALKHLDLLEVQHLQVRDNNEEKSQLNKKAKNTSESNSNNEADMSRNLYIAELEKNYRNMENRLKKAEDYVKYLVKQLNVKNVTEQNLQYPLHFSNSSSKIENAMKVKNKEIQNIIDAMKDIEVPYGSFINHQINEVIIIKIHNDSGINYIVSGDYESAILV